MSVLVHYKILGVGASRGTVAMLEAYNMALARLRGGRTSAVEWKLHTSTFVLPYFFNKLRSIDLCS